MQLLRGEMFLKSWLFRLSFYLNALNSLNANRYKKQDELLFSEIYKFIVFFYTQTKLV